MGFSGSGVKLRWVSVMLFCALKRLVPRRVATSQCVKHAFALKLKSVLPGLSNGGAWAVARIISRIAKIIRDEANVARQRDIALAAVIVRAKAILIPARDDGRPARGTHRAGDKRMGKKRTLRRQLVDVSAFAQPACHNRRDWDTDLRRRSKEYSVYQSWGKSFCVTDGTARPDIEWFWNGWTEAGRAQGHRPYGLAFLRVVNCW